MPEPTKDFWTWAEFNRKVDELCPLEVNRSFGPDDEELGLVGSKFYRNQIRQAVLDLQHFIPEYQKNHETIYIETDFVEDGHAHVAVPPPMGKMRSAWYYDTDKQLRFPVVEVAWEHRFDLTTRKVQDTLDSNYIVLTQASIGALAAAETLNMLKAAGRRHAGLMAISPQHDRIYVYPKVKGKWMLSIFWDGDKLDWRPNEQAPYGEKTANAVALWVQAAFLRVVDRDVGLASATGQLYAIERTNLFVAAKEKGTLQ